MIDEYNGKPRTRAWPVPRGPNRSPTNVYWTNWLRGVTFLWRYQPARVQELLMRATAGTPWMARDPFISAARGRAWSFTDQNGRTYYPMPVREAVSQSLDAIAQLAGSMLWRGPNGWLPVPPATSTGTVLTTTDLDAVPSWLPGGGGGAALNAWSPNTPPETPDPADDEFQTVAPGVPSGWTAYTPGTATPAAVDDAGLVLSLATQATTTLGGIYKALPGGDWTITTKVSTLANRAGDLYNGLALFEDATDPTKRVRTYTLYTAAAGLRLRVTEWSDFDTVASNPFNVALNTRFPSGLYLRIRRIAGAYFYDASDDGLGWLQQFSDTPIYAPAHIGLIGTHSNTGIPSTVRFPFFRVDTTNTAVTALLRGRRV